MTITNLRFGGGTFEAYVQSFDGVAGADKPSRSDAAAVTKSPYRPPMPGEVQVLAGSSGAAGSHEVGEGTWSDASGQFREHKAMHPEFGLH